MPYLQVVAIGRKPPPFGGRIVSGECLMFAKSCKTWRCLGLVCLAVSAQAYSIRDAVAQTRPKSADSTQNQQPVKPYAGQPIYLDEPEVIAEPTIVRQEKVPPETYPDGKLRVEREVAYFSDNHVEANGIYREYYPNGKLFVEGEYNRGRQHGAWTYYFDNGQVNRKSIFANGQPNGAWDVFRSDGTLTAKRSFKNGVRDGEWITYDESGKRPLREEHYLNGKADGVWKVWFPNGKQKQQGSFKEGLRHGPTTEWNENGEKVIEINYAENKLDGTASQKLADGRTIVQQYKDGKLISQEKK
jgi:antitoxin component YwqK of YwqJK toxin-antitoxin module